MIDTIFFNKCEGKIYTSAQVGAKYIIVVSNTSAIANFRGIFLIFAVKLNWMI